MKKILLLSMLAVLCSCSQGLRNKAQKQMEKTMKNMAKDPSSVNISNLKEMINNDSICIFHFDFSAKNGFGGVTSCPIEYVYLIKKGKAYDMVRDLSKKESIMEMSREEYQKKQWGENSYLGKLPDEGKKAYIIYSNASILSAGKKPIGYDKNDIDNW